LNIKKSLLFLGLYSQISAIIPTYAITM